MAASPSTADQQFLDDLDKKLWNAADRLRPNLDAAVCKHAVLAAYGFHPAKDLLAQLLTLNQSVAANIKIGSPVTAHGLPLDGKDRLGYISTDCIMPSKP